MQWKSIIYYKEKSIGVLFSEKKKDGERERKGNFPLPFSTGTRLPCAEQRNKTWAEKHDSVLGKKENMPLRWHIKEREKDSLSCSGLFLSVYGDRLKRNPVKLVCLIQWGRDWKRSESIFKSHGRRRVWMRDAARPAQFGAMMCTIKITWGLDA